MIENNKTRIYSKRVRIFFLINISRMKRKKKLEANSLKSIILSSISKNTKTAKKNYLRNNQMIFSVSKKKLEVC